MALASCAKYSRLCWRAIVSLSLYWKSLLVRCCKFRTHCLGRARARARREDKFLDLAFPTEDAIVEICGSSVVKVATEHPVTEDSLRVVEAVSDCSSARRVKQGLMEYLSKEVREELQLARLVVPMLMALNLGI